MSLRGKGQATFGSLGSQETPLAARKVHATSSQKTSCGLSEDFEQHCATAIEDVRTKKPEHYLKVIASLLPRGLELDVSVGPSQKLKVALSEFASDYHAVKDAMQRIGVSPVMIEAVTIEEDE